MIDISGENVVLVGALLLFVAVMAGKVAYRFGAPALLLFLGVGMLFGLNFISYRSVEMTQFVGMIALCIILFTGGMDTKFSEIKPIIGPGVVLATVGVVMTAFVLAGFVWLVAPWLGIEIPFALALLLASTMSSTDSASVFSILRSKKQGLKQNLRPLLELPDYLDKLSAALGVRLCMPEDGARGDSLLLLEAEPLAVSVGIASMRKKGEAVSGDRGTYFKTDAGQLCVILSDGMGCGESAADGSIGTVGMLEEFLRSGVSPALAMKLLNSAMLLRDGENWGYATVDLMCMNLFTGEADFYKYGAAPTYVKSGGALKKLRCTSFAPGLEQESGKAPDELHMHLKPGSVAVIASDGVVSDGQDLWLRRLLNDFEDGDMKTLAGSVVRAAIREYGRGDDMTALAVKVEVRS